MWDDTFNDAMDDTVSAEVIDNHDGKHVIVNLTGEPYNGGEPVAIGIALTADDANRMAEILQALAAGLTDY